MRWEEDHLGKQEVISSSEDWNNFVSHFDNMFFYTTYLLPLFYMDILPAHMSVHRMHDCCLKKSEGGIIYPGNIIAVVCKLPHGWVLGIEPWSLRKAASVLNC